MADDDGKTPRRGRLWRRLGWAAAGLALLAVLVVFVLPTPLARLLVERQLDALNIAHEGVDTVSVDLWNSRVEAGPIAMGAPDRPAQLGDLVITYDVGALFDGRALTRTVAIAGVDVAARRAEDGTVTINGVAPPPPGEAAAEDAPETAFGFGLDTLVFTNSRLTLEDFTGGTLSLALDRLELRNLYTWSPETPGEIALQASLNDAAIDLRGSAQPFAQDVVVDLEGSVEGVTLARVETFIGDTELTRREGTLSLTGAHRVMLHADGSVEARGDNRLRLDALDVGTPAGDRLRAGSVAAPLSYTLTLAPDGSVGLDGDLAVTLADVALQGADGASLTLATASAKAPEIDVDRGADARFDDAPTAPARTQDTPSLVALIVDGVVRLARVFLANQIELQGPVSAELTGLSLSAPLDAGQASAQVDAATLDVSALDVLSDAGGAWRGAATATLETQGAQVAQPGLAARWDGLTLDVSGLDAETEPDATRLSLDAALTLAKPQAEAGATVAAESADVGLDGLRAARGGADGAGSLSGALSLEAAGLTTTAPGETPLDAALDSLTLTLDSIEARQGDAQSVTVAGRLDGAGARLALGGAAPAEATAESLGAALSRLRATLPPDAAPAIDADATVTAGGVEATAGGVSARVGGAEARLAPLRLQGGAPSLSGALSLRDATAESGGPARSVTLSALTLDGLAMEEASRLTVETARLEGLDAALRLALGDGGAAEGWTAGAAPAGGDAFTARVGRIDVAAGATVALSDGDGLSLRATLDRLKAGPVDTAAPGEPLSLELAAGFDAGGSLAVSGSAAPLAAPPVVDLTARLEAFPLAPLSPLVRDLAGYSVDSGEATADVEARGDGAGLDGAIDLRVAALSLGQPTEDAAARVREQFGVPLQTGVALLKNAEGVIALTLPLTGSTAEPSVDYTPVIEQAIGGALASLMPTGWLGAGGGGGDPLSIDPATFAPGTATLTEAGLATVAQVADVLAARPALRLRVCGKAARADLLAARGRAPDAAGDPAEPTQGEIEAALALAQDRTEAAMDALAGAGADPGQLSRCDARYSFESDLPPRAEFHL